jgi:hypothetical protein
VKDDAEEKAARGEYAVLAASEIDPDQSPG